MGIEEELERAIGEVRQSVRQRFVRLGEMGVDYAKKNGTYHDVTGNLRASNTYTATEDMLELRNTADYASDIEARGHDVLSGAILQIRKEIEQ